MAESHRPPAAACAPSAGCTRRGLLVGAAGLALRCTALDAAQDARTTRPAAGDLLVKIGDTTATPLAPGDIVAGATPTMAWPMAAEGGRRAQWVAPQPPRSGPSRSRRARRAHQGARRRRRGRLFGDLHAHRLRGRRRFSSTSSRSIASATSRSSIRATRRASPTDRRRATCRRCRSASSMAGWSWPDRSRRGRIRAGRRLRRRHKPKAEVRRGGPPQAEQCVSLARHDRRGRGRHSWPLNAQRPAPCRRRRRRCRCRRS